MALYLYEVQLTGGSTHKKFAKFDKNAYEFKPVPIGFGGSSAHSVISHHIDIDTLRSNLVLGLTATQKEDLRIAEITTETLDAQGEHRFLREMVENRFLRYDRRGYPNIPEIPDLDDDDE